MGSNPARKAPWFKFYGADWRSDLGLRECSYAARGLWMDMLTIMHEAEPYGHLLIGNKPATAKRLSALLGGTEKEVAGLLGQLEEAGVFSRGDDGTIYSRRMIRDAERDAENRENGKRGGNPHLTGKVNPDPTPPVNGGVNPQDNHTVNPTHNPTVNRGDKAQKLEARSEKQERTQGPPATPRPARAAAPLVLDAWADADQWAPLAEKWEVSTLDGQKHPCLGGWHLDTAAQLVAEASGVSRTDWQPLAGWIALGLDLNEHILPAIRSVATRHGYKPPRFLSYFDAAVRERRAA